MKTTIEMADEVAKIYIVKSSEYYKIGMTKGSLADRVAQLQTGNPLKIEQIAFAEVYDAPKIERLIHKELDVRRLSGEWFNLDEDMLTGLLNALDDMAHEKIVVTPRLKKLLGKEDKYNLFTQIKRANINRIMDELLYRDVV